MGKINILTDTQKLFLKLFGEREFSRKFYLSGGTALAGFYIPYRLSEDLDFFSEQEIELDEITAFIQSVKNQIGFTKFEFNTSFNRNLFFLTFSSQDSLKLEFTFYPFTQLNLPKKTLGIKIDSIEDIAANKLFTIYQRPRSRDFIDLYMIIKKYKFTVSELIKQTKVKFDSHIDPLKLGSQFLLVKKLKDYPRMLDPLKESDWQNFFLLQAQKLSSEIIQN